MGAELSQCYRSTQTAFNSAATRLSGVPGWAGQLAQKVGLGGARESFAAYVEAGTDTTLTYITDGPHVTAGGLDYAGMARDTAFLGTGVLGVEVASLGVYQKERGESDE